MFKSILLKFTLFRFILFRFILLKIDIDLGSRHAIA